MLIDRVYLEKTYGGNWNFDGFNTWTSGDRAVIKVYKLVETGEGTTPYLMYYLYEKDKEPIRIK